MRRFWNEHEHGPFFERFFDLMVVVGGFAFIYETGRLFGWW